MQRLVCALVPLLAAGQSLYRIDTVAGSAQAGDGGPAVQAQIGTIQGVAADRAGNLYISDTDNHRVRKVNAAGIITTVAGTGAAGVNGDGGPAVSAALNLPYGLAADAAGNLYIADLGNNRVRRVSPDGVISTYAGGGTASDDGGPAIAAALHTPRNLAIDAVGNLYVSEFEGHRVRKVTPDGHIATVAGTGLAGFAGDGGPATAAQLAYPAGLALDRAGNLYIADSQNQRIRQVAAGGAISTAVAPLVLPTAVAVDATGKLFIADNGTLRSCTPAATCSVLSGVPSAGDLAMDASGDLYVANGGQVLLVSIGGQTQTVAGDGWLHAIGDGGPATSAQLFQPAAVALDPAGNLLIADSGTGRVRSVGTNGTITTIDGPADLHSPMGVAATSAGAVVIADTGNHRIRQANGGTIASIAGTGAAGAGPEGLSPLETALNAPRGVCRDRAGMLYIVDTGNHRLLRLATEGVLLSVAGNGSPGSAGDGGPARLAQLNLPSGCTTDAGGSLYIADTANHRIRLVTPDGTIQTFAGTGQTGALDSPQGVAVDDSGDVFIADTGNHRIREVTPDGIIQTIAGTGAAGFSGDGGPALAAQFDAPGGLALDSAGNVYVADTGNNRVRRLAPPSAAFSAQGFSVVNAASLAPGPVSPGEMVSIFGSGMGPATASAAAFDPNGALPTLLAGTQVLFDGTAAPLYYVQSGQIQAQVPYSVTGTTYVQVFYRNSLIDSADLTVASAAPGLFPPANTQDNPAPRGSLAVFYATGEGLTAGPNLAGQMASPPYPQPLQPVTLLVAGIAAQLLYAGSAPGTAGVLQLNAIMPGGYLQPGPATVQLWVGSAASPPVTIWLQ